MKVYYCWPPRKKGYHRHHLKPKHQGGTDADGIVYLTKEEHIQAHMDLYEKYGHNGDYQACVRLGKAYYGPSPQRGAKHPYSHKNPNRVKHPMQGRKHSEESKAKISASKMGSPGTMTGRKNPGLAASNRIRKIGNKNCLTHGLSHTKEYKARKAREFRARVKAANK